MRISSSSSSYRPELHPLEQVSESCEYLVDFMPALRGDTEMVSGVASRHNATEHDVPALRQRTESGHTRLLQANDSSAPGASLDERSPTGHRHDEALLPQH